MLSDELPDTKVSFLIDSPTTVARQDFHYRISYFRFLQLRKMKLKYFCWSLYFALCLGQLRHVNAVSDIIVVDLNGMWTATNANKSISVPSTVPGTIYTDLEAAGILNDSYYRFNDINYRWVGYDNWTFSRSFDVSTDVLSKTYVYLVAEGLDTVASVYLNDALVGQSDDMHVRYRWEIKTLLKDLNNSLVVSFTSPVTYAANQQQLYIANYGYDVPPDCPPTVQHGECHVNFIRKIQSQFAWDWGPAFPTMSIWQPIRLEAIDTCVIRNVATYPSPSGDNWNLGVGIYFDCTSASKQNGTVTVQLGTAVPWTMIAPISLEPDNTGTAFVNLTGTVTQSIDLWWPHGYGNQTLYNLTVSYSNVDASEPSSTAIRVGFRTVELIQDEVIADNVTYGNEFYFKINNVPIFLKGSNWIPADSFPTRITDDYLRNLLQSTVDANMNSLRVWGGGQYETDTLYDITDELGILIWQDLMFACAMYPTDSQFMDAVTTEVTQQVRRLQYHPSILLWSGNNENEAALAQGWYATYPRDVYYNDYVKLYVNTTMVIVNKEDTSRPYITSSPSNGVETIKEGYVAQNPQDPRYGDVHFYTYTSDGWNWKSYPRPRLASEYGFQSWPSFETLSKVSIEEDWDWTSAFMESRQHHGMGNLEIAMGIELHMNLPTGCTRGGSTVLVPRSTIVSMITQLVQGPTKTCSSVEGYKGMLYQSQIYQAMSIKTESEYYRRARTELINGLGHTMGALYWQLDDIWQGASWASIEYGGKWKILHYFAARFFAPILISPYLSDDGTTVAYAVVDTNDSYKANLHVHLYRWNSFQPASASTVEITLVPNAAVNVFEQSTDELYQSANCSANECFFYFVLTDTNNEEQIGPSNYIFPSSFKKAVGMTKANISLVNMTALSVNEDEGQFELVIKSDAVAPYVWLEATGIRGRFSDNGFLMVEPEITLTFYSWESVTASVLAQSLQIQSLMDLY